MQNSSFRVILASICALLITGCAGSLSPTVPDASEEDIGMRISHNLRMIHEQYCSGTSDANARLTAVKAKSAPLKVVDEKTNEISRIWFIAEPSTTQNAGVFTNRWGVYVHEPEGSNTCGVGYVRPDQIDVLKRGKAL